MKKTLAILATTLSILPVVANAFPIASTGEGLNVLVGGTDPIIAKHGDSRFVCDRHRIDLPSACQ